MDNALEVTRSVRLEFWKVRKTIVLRTSTKKWAFNRSSPRAGKTRVCTVADKNFGEGWSLLGALREEWTHVFDLWKQTAFGRETSRSHGGLP